MVVPLPFRKEILPLASEAVKAMVSSVRDQAPVRLMVVLPRSVPATSTLMFRGLGTDPDCLRAARSVSS